MNSHAARIYVPTSAISRRFYFSVTALRLGRSVCEHVDMRQPSWCFAETKSILQPRALRCVAHATAPMRSAKLSPNATSYYVAQEMMFGLFQDEKPRFTAAVNSAMDKLSVPTVVVPRFDTLAANRATGVQRALTHVSLGWQVFSGHGRKSQFGRWGNSRPVQCRIEPRLR